MQTARFHLARCLALTRIGFDYCRSMSRPRCTTGDVAPHERPALGLIREQPPIAPRSRSSLTLVSWNIHRGYRPDLVRATLGHIIAEEDPDLLLLQEVPVYRNGPLWAAAGFRSLFPGAHLAYAPMHTVRRQSSYYPFLHTGLLTVARHPLSAVEVHELPTVSQPKLGRFHLVKRIALYTALQLPDRSVGVYNVHLENTTRPSGRGAQARAVVEAAAGRDDDLAVIGGDFNTLFGRIEPAPAELMRGAFHEVPMARRRFRILDIDRFFVRAARGRPATSGRRLTGRGSDHEPVLARVELGTCGAYTGRRLSSGVKPHFR